MAVSPGKNLGPYEIIDPIGAGGMGEVYKARDTRLERTVAIKVFTNYENGLTRTEACARSAGVLRPCSIGPCSI